MKILTRLRELIEGERIFADQFEVQTSPSGTKSVSPITVLLDDEMMDTIRKAGRAQEPLPQKSSP